MANIYGPILPLQLDSRNTAELLRAIQTRINLESNGQLTDFTPASPLSAITEGQAFAESELLFYLNNLPEAFSLQWLRLLGIQRKLGSRAYADVTFFKVAGFNRSVIIPAGTKLFADTLQFTLLDEVRIGTNEVSKIGTCQSEKWGSIYNVGPGLINRIERNFAGLESLSNSVGASGASDIETIDEMKARAFTLLSKRNLTTSFDFEDEIRNIAPEAAIVKALTYEERFQISKELSGNVVLVVGDEDGKRLSNALLTQIVNSIRPRVTLGTGVSLLDPNVIPIDVIVEIYYNPLEFTGGSEAYANVVLTTLRNAISPASYPLGSQLNYQDILRRLYEIEFVSSVNTLDIKIMIKNPLHFHSPCFGLEGTENEDGTKCLYDHETMLDKNSQVYTNVSPISTYKLQRAEIALTSINDFSSLVYTRENLYRV